MSEEPSIDRVKDVLWSMQKDRARDALFLSERSIMELMLKGSLFLKILTDDQGNITQQVIPADQVLIKGTDDE